MNPHQPEVALVYNMGLSAYSREMASSEEGVQLGGDRPPCRVMPALCNHFRLKGLLPAPSQHLAHSYAGRRLAWPCPQRPLLLQQ